MHKQKKKKRSGAVGRFLRRTLLVIFTVLLLAAGGLALFLNTVFNGPSESARDLLTMSLSEAAATSWIPEIFLDEETVARIRSRSGAPLTAAFSDVSLVSITTADSGEWADCPDGIRIEEYQGSTYTAHIMIIRDPSLVYMVASTDGPFSAEVPGTQIHNEIVSESAIAAINAGTFLEDGSIPAGLLIADGQVRSDKYADLVPEAGFAGFTFDNILLVAQSMTAEQAKELNIRDGCAFGPVLIMNGIVNQQSYNAGSGYSPRTAIGQRADGAVIFLCIDGRQPSSLGGTYRDIIDILVEYGAVNACSMNGGSSSVMMYRDSCGLYGEAGAYVTISSCSLLQSEPGRMPSFWMVRPADEEG